jgi:hypothetical protein
MGRSSHGPELRYHLTWDHRFILRVIDADVSVDPVTLETADLSQWLHEAYYDDGGKPPYFTETDLRAITMVLLRLLRFHPPERPSANHISLEPLLGDHSSLGRQKNGP